MNNSLTNIKKQLQESKQEHLLNFWDDLNKSEQAAFLDQLSDVSFKEIGALLEKTRTVNKSKETQVKGNIEPIPESQIESEKCISLETINLYRNQGLDAISNNSVAVLLLAGGQGSRLGVDYPKGMFSVGLPSKKSLYQLQAERIQRILKIAHQKTGTLGRICWYIMTSESTNELTYKYFKDHNFFGGREEDIVLFQQGVLPCYDLDGKIILNGKGSLAMAPDGNGGIYKALEKNCIIDDMLKRGIKYVHVYCVDNILVKVADPIFIGYCINKNADCAAKVIKKTNPTEPVGVICKVDGLFKVIEYSEIDPDLACLYNEKNELVFNAGNICNHFFTVKFLDEVIKKHEKKLPFHIAQKKIAFINKDGDLINPETPNGIKIEKFVFDVFQFTNNFVTWSVECSSEFSPLKNTEGAKKDCPSTARNHLLSLHKQYVVNAGGTVQCEEVEISPLVSYAGEDLEKLVKNKVFKERTILQVDDEKTFKNGFIC